MGICVGLQALFEGSSEDPSICGLGIIKANLDRFDDTSKSVPHIGWNSANTSDKQVYGLRPSSKYYYVHSYKVPYRKGEFESQGWTVATARYGDEEFVGAIAKDNILATQFHPEKSGMAGLRVLKAFLDGKHVVITAGTGSGKLVRQFKRLCSACSVQSGTLIPLDNLNVRLAEDLALCRQQVPSFEHQRVVTQRESAIIVFDEDV